MIAPTFKAKASSSGVWSPGGSTHTASPSTSTKPASSSILSTTSIIQNGGVSPHKSSVHKPSASFKTEINESSSNVTSVVSNGISGGSFAPKSSRTEQDSPPSNAPPPPPLPPLPIWKPGSQPPSPAQEKKQFKPVSFESPTLARKNFQQEAKSEPPPPWESRLAGSRSAPAAPGLSGLAAPPAPPAPPTLPRAQNPTITLLQKAREGQLPRGAAYLQQERERDPPRDRRSPPRYGQGEPVYSLRRDYASDTESSSRRKMVEPQKYDGIGPTTKEGMPIVLRSEVKEGNQSKWYKKMYDTIHRNKFDDDYVTVRYKSRRAHPSALHPGPRTNQYAYFDPRSGYLSEPEGGKGWVSDAYDSDASAKVPGRRHSTLDRRGKENEVVSEYMPSVGKYSTLASAKASQEVYKNQPGRIEDYIPGRSSVVDKEAKQWWDEVMDIFDGQLANASVNHPQINNKQSVSTSAISKSYMARALKESGYESDSTLVFRRRGLGGDGIDGASSPLSPREQRQAYREVQAGGEPPLQGFRKPAPDRPKDPELAPIPPPKGISTNSYDPESPRRYVESDVNIHYRVPVRQEPRPLVPEEELARRQADHMRRVYQEERRRKYLQELQDMNSRRHTDNFTPAQKSPISLNRYDTFGSTGLVRPHQIARALHNFTGQSTRELSFRRGDLLLVRRRIDQNWFEGECDGQVGLFPTNYVEMIDSDAPPTPTSRPSEGRARAKFNFVAQTHLELGLKKGELVTLLRRVDDNWYEGKLGGRKGIFPVSYVEVLVEPQPNRAELTPSIASGKPVASPAAHSVVGAAGAASLGAHHYTPLINNPALSNSPSSTAPLTLPSE